MTNEREFLGHGAWRQLNEFIELNQSLGTLEDIIGVAPEVVAYVRFRPENLHRASQGDENCFPTPRSLVKAAEFVDRAYPSRRRRRARRARR